MNSGLTSDPRANRTFHGREEPLIDFSSYTTSPPSQTSTPTTTAGVVLRNSTGRSQNPRPSSLVMDLETLSEDSKEPSPKVEIPDHFDFNDLKLPQSLELATSPLPNDIRDRSASSDTITFDDNAALAYDDLPTPTPFQFMKNTKAENSENMKDKRIDEKSEDEKTPENDASLGTNLELFGVVSEDKNAIDASRKDDILENEPFLDLGASNSHENTEFSTADSDVLQTTENNIGNDLINLDSQTQHKSEQFTDPLSAITLDDLSTSDFLPDVQSLLKPESTPKKSDKVSEEEASLLSPSQDEPESTPRGPDNNSEEEKYLLSPSRDEPESTARGADNTSEEEKYLLSSSRDDLDSFGSRDDLASSMDSLDWNEASLGNLKPGMAVWLGEGKTGVIRFTGPTEFAPGMWVGVELDKPGGTRIDILIKALCTIYLTSLFSFALFSIRNTAKITKGQALIQEGSIVDPPPPPLS